MNAHVGLDLRETIIESVDDEIVIFGGFDPSRSGDSSATTADLRQVYAVAVKDRQGFELAIKALEGIFGDGRPLFESREYLGTTIHTYRGGGMSMPETDRSAERLYLLAVAVKRLGREEEASRLLFELLEGDPGY